MKTNRYLLPHRFRVLGWVIAGPSLAALMYYILFPKPSLPSFFVSFTRPGWNRVVDVFEGDPLYATMAMIGLMVGLLFIAFSRLKVEDEYMLKLRGDSLIWAIFVNSFLLMAAFLGVYGGNFFYVALFNLYTLLILFIIKFNLTLYRFKKSDSHEE